MDDLSRILVELLRLGDLEAKIVHEWDDETIGFIHSSPAGKYGGTIKLADLSDASLAELLSTMLADIQKGPPAE